MEAETCIARARQVAQRQGARLWELRATLSLCRLRQRQGRQAEVLPALAALYARFREGFTLPDLHAARELLEEAGETA
jgi:predicted ATPase